tara:strand:+ start:8381 stop:8827 length:447 start_codon:yes stop_codon:yes gene_type:complete
MNSQSLNEEILCIKAKNYNVGQHQRFHYTNAFLIPSDNQLLNQIANNPTQPKTDVQEDTLQSQTSTDPVPMAPAYDEKKATSDFIQHSMENKVALDKQKQSLVRTPHRPQRPTASMGDGVPKFGTRQGITTPLVDGGGKRKKNRARNP